MYYVYVLRSQKNGTKYIGLTRKKPLVRLKEHNTGTNSYTRRNRPYEMVRIENYEEENFARKRERFFKTGHGRSVLKKLLEKSN